MLSNKSVRLISVAIVAVMVGSGAASAAGRVMEINPNLIPKNLAGPAPKVSPSRVVRCTDHVIYGKAEMFQDLVGVPVSVPASVKNALLPKALNNWKMVVAQRMGAN